MRNGHWTTYLLEKIKYQLSITVGHHNRTHPVKGGVGAILTQHSVRFGVYLSKIVIYDLCIFQIFLTFFNSLYQELSGYVSHVSLVLHIYPQEVQEHRLFCSFSWKIRFLLLAHVGKKVKNFTGAHMCTQTQLIMNNLSPTNMPIIKNQVQLGAFKV